MLEPQASDAPTSYLALPALAKRKQWGPKKEPSDMNHFELTDHYEHLLTRTAAPQHHVRTMVRNLLDRGAPYQAILNNRVFKSRVPNLSDVVKKYADDKGYKWEL